MSARTRNRYFIQKKSKTDRAIDCLNNLRASLSPSFHYFPFHSPTKTIFFRQSVYPAIYLSAHYFRLFMFRQRFFTHYPSDFRFPPFRRLQPDVFSAHPVLTYLSNSFRFNPDHIAITATTTPPIIKGAGKSCASVFP